MDRIIKGLDKYTVESYYESSVGYVSEMVLSSEGEWVHVDDIRKVFSVLNEIEDVLNELFMDEEECIQVIKRLLDTM